MKPATDAQRRQPDHAATAVRAQAHDRPGDEPPLTEAEIVAAAARMQLADGVGAGVRLLPRLLDPQLTLEALARLLAAEPALAIRVLRVANAPYYGQAGSVATLARATQLLGQDALRGIAAAACFDGMNGGPNGAECLCGGLDLVAFKRHSLASGVAAQALARRLAPDLAEQAFMAGVLHDLGLLLLWRLRPAKMAAQARRRDGVAADPSTAVGMHHAECGRLLMRTWALPEAFATAIAAHEREGGEAPATPGPDLAGLLRVGHGLAIEAGFGLADEAAPPGPAPEGWQPALDELAVDLPQAIERLVTAFTH